MAEIVGLVLEGVLKVAFSNKNTTDEGRVKHMISQTPSRAEEMIQLPTFERAEDWKIVTSMFRSDPFRKSVDQALRNLMDGHGYLGFGRRLADRGYRYLSTRRQSFSPNWWLILEPIPRPPRNSTALSTSQSGGDKLLHVLCRIGSYNLLVPRLLGGINLCHDS
ncbi:hypothetical protein GCG54_00015363 [Colletotrichum gloeosporioides]|uniref:Uncharacterized protein n=1 Tax=Colletotrichum gloeosporioides TaxID=474922 RepID=A0A8H4FN23_COLGL|nr:uncharacterized protein GCG54_00015363 [Colletotrichum gloeosporioides]KAF3807981.1 hypothetical protein GCG54_00015363 [Colletotrichum gloeosporioides]